MTTKKTKSPRRTKKTNRPFALESYLEKRRRIVERALARSSRTPGMDDVGEALRYSLLAGGKRLRPVLVLAACEAVGGKVEQGLPAACAIEMIHTYSLVHDDLPAMDNDNLRRGRPTCHKAFDEATAILAGDALLTEAFTVLSDPRAGKLSDKTRVALIDTLSRASGWRGMVGGQALDLAAEGKQISEKELRRLHAAKTGALLTAALTLGGLSGGASAIQLAALEKYGKAIGLAFQIVDDILDVTSTTETLGKPVGSDEGHDKSTFPKLMGLERSRKEADKLIAAAKRAVEPLGERAAALRALADYVVARVN